MKPYWYLNGVRGFVVRAACLVACLAMMSGQAQSVRDALEVVRGAHQTDRKALVAEALELTETESAAFWPLYRTYRTAMDEVGDGLVKLVLEYADALPGLEEDRARQLLADYSALERKYTGTRISYLKRFSKILPATKALRFAQVENRLDLAIRLQLASVVPLAPARTVK